MAYSDLFGVGGADELRRASTDGGDEDVGAVHHESEFRGGIAAVLVRPPWEMDGGQRACRPADHHP